MDRIATDCDVVVCQFLTLGDLLAFRSCSRAQLLRYGPARGGLWELASPTADQVIIQIRTNPVAHIELLNSVYPHIISQIDVLLEVGHSCVRGRTAMAQWLVTRFDLTTVDFRQYDNAALRDACMHGHLATAQWLVNHFHLTANDARADNNGVLRFACEGGHLLIAQWLTKHFGLTAADARAKCNFALRYACANGHLAVAQWLASRFHLTKDDARSMNNYALRNACARGHRAVIDWLMTRFSITLRSSSNNLG